MQRYSCHGQCYRRHRWADRHTPRPVLLGQHLDDPSRSTIWVHNRGARRLVSMWLIHRARVAPGATVKMSLAAASSGVDVARYRRAAL